MATIANRSKVGHVMDLEINGAAPIKGDCGHTFEVSVVGLSHETDLICPECGAVDHLTVEQVAGIRSDIRLAAGEAGRDVFASAINDAIKKATRGSKNVKYRKK